MNETAVNPRVHPAYDDLKKATQAARQRLTHALAIEADWRFHDGPEWAARYWRTFGDLAVPADNQAEVAHYRRVTRRSAWPTLKASEAEDVRTIFRSLLTLLHPALDPAAASDERAAIWPRVQRAYRDGDRSALVAAWSDTRVLVRKLALPEDVVALRAEHGRLVADAEAADRRLAGMSGQFPFCLREQLDDPVWVRRQRLALQQIHAFTQAPAGAERTIGHQQVS